MQDQHANADPDTGKSMLHQGLLRKILQENYFVIPNTEPMREAYDRVTELIQLIACEDWKMDLAYLEAKSQATCAYLILEEQL